MKKTLSHAEPSGHLDPAASTVLWELRSRANTVDSIAEALELTPNAVRNQLQKLEKLGFIRRAGKRATSSKPAVLYEITIEGQGQFSKLYLPVLSQFIEVAEERCQGTQLGEMMEDTGAQLANRYVAPTGSLKTRVESAARLLCSLGGLAESVRVRDGYLLQSGGCPLAALTAHETAACSILRAFLQRYLGARVAVCCETGPAPRCCFKVQAA
jgi:predicted ArsR family transcriptional regulator